MTRSRSRHVRRRSLAPVVTVLLACATTVTGAALLNAGPAHAAAQVGWAPDRVPTGARTYEPVSRAATVARGADIEQVRAARALLERATRLAEKRAKALKQLERAADQRAAQLQAAREARLAETWVAPVQGYVLSAGFGAKGPLWEADHTGQDFSVGLGTPVVSIGQGVVVLAGWDGAYGKRVAVEHADGAVSWYCHLSVYRVAVGDVVGAGQRLGLSGSTGNSTGPHLHFEIRPFGGDPVDPLPYLAAHGVTV